MTILMGVAIALVLSGRVALPDGLAREAYELLTEPARLPPEVQTAWAAELGQKQLHVAAPHEKVNLSDVGVAGLPRHRLLQAAVGPRYVVLHFISGGFASTARVVVVEREGVAARVLGAGRTAKVYGEPKAFRDAIRSGRLFKDLGPPRARP